MRLRKAYRTGLLIALMSAAVFFRLLSPSGPSGQFRELSRLHILYWRLGGYPPSPLFRCLPQKMKDSLALRVRGRADNLEHSLYRSGELVELTFWLPTGKRMPVNKRWRDVMIASPSLLAYGWRGESDMLTVMCRPSAVAGLAAEFYSGSTNRLTYDGLRLLGGDEDTPCRLPDGSIVDVFDCQRWISSSVAGGWSVGVMYESGCSYRRLTVSRRRVAEMATASASHHFKAQ